MPSCSNSSNIQASLTSLSVIQGGSRLSVEIPYFNNSGFTNGSVVRYDVISDGYTLAKADTASNSEVFGVVESYNASNNKFNVVIYGSINIDSLNLYNIDGTTGGSGGNDVYFLSGSTAGYLQNLAPTNLDHIIKPVYQTARHGTNFSGVVMNYLGYRIGGEIQSVLDDTEIGNLQIVIGSNNFTEGFVDASLSHRLPVADYPEFYSKFGTQYGYVEKIVVTTDLSGNISTGMKVSQTASGSGTYSGTIVEIDRPNKTLLVGKEPNTATVSLNKQLIVDPSGLNLSYSIQTASIYETQTPIIRLPQPLIIDTAYGKPAPDQKVSVGVKVQPQGIRVTIPSSVAADTITADSLIVGTDSSNVETILDDHEARLAVIEDRLRI